MQTPKTQTPTTRKAKSKARNDDDDDDVVDKKKETNVDDEVTTPNRASKRAKVDENGGRQTRASRR